MPLVDEWRRRKSAAFDLAANSTARRTVAVELGGRSVEVYANANFSVYSAQRCNARCPFCVEELVRALVADEGLALFAGLNAIPKKSYLSEYSSRITHSHTTRLLAAFYQQVSQDDLFPGRSFNLDFHSVPYYGEHPVVERHFVSARKRGRLQPSNSRIFSAKAAK